VIAACRRASRLPHESAALRGRSDSSGERSFLFSNRKAGQGLAEIIAFIEQQGMLVPGRPKAAAA
jgi:hypothetical protein